MGECVQCHIKGIFIKVTKEKLCYSCAMKNAFNEQHPDFIQTKTLFFQLPAKILFFFSVDDKNKKFAFSYIYTNSAIGFQVFNYKDLIDFEVSENNKIVTSGTGGGALLGGLLLGTAGAIIGASGSRTSRQLCTSLRLTMYLNSIYNPPITNRFYAWLRELYRWIFI